MAPGRWGASLDMYRKVPQDLMEGSKRGTMMSSFALFAIAMLFFMETRAFFTSRCVANTVTVSYALPFRPRSCYLYF